MKTLIEQIESLILKLKLKADNTESAIIKGRIRNSIDALNKLIIELIVK